VRHGPPPPRRPALSEPELLIIKLLYLSGLPGSHWFERPMSYQLSVHVGEDARSDPPPHPGRFSTRLLQPSPPQVVSPEEEVLRKHIRQSIAAMRAQEGPMPMEAEVVEEQECRFKTRVAVRLSEEGPGPAAGGPAYFRIDVWAEKEGGVFSHANRRELYARAFVPITEPQWQRRPCTWPVVNAQGKDVAYLTCEFAFAHAPAPVRRLQAVDATSDHVVLAWQNLPDDKICPILGYRVEACALHRQNKHQPQSSRPSSTLAWQTVGELELTADPGLVVPNLKADTRYRFRVRAFNEAGAGELAEVEAATGPCAPGTCGQPRLAGCAGPVLSIEWDSPLDDGGVEVVAYRMWVRPYTASKADPSSWIEVAQPQHNKGGVQRAEIHTEDLNPGVSRYLCSVAAINAAGEVGPATPDASCLPFPNPCAVCGPTAAQALLAIGDYPSHNYLRDLAGNGANITLMEPGKRPERVNILPQDESFPGLIQPAAPEWNSALVQQGGSGGHNPQGFAREWSHSAEPAYRDSLYRSSAPAYNEGANLDYQQPPLDYQQPYYDHYQGDAMYHHSPAVSSFTPVVDGFGTGPSGGLGMGGTHSAQGFQAMEQQEVMRLRLQEKREQLDASLLRYSQVGSQLKYSPDNELLRQSHEEAEIEAAGLQAEVAVLSQKLNDLDEAVRVGAAPAASFNLESPDNLTYNNHM